MINKQGQHEYVNSVSCPVKTFSHQTLMNQGEGLCYYVWDAEGEWVTKDTFMFHTGDRPDGGEYPTAPLLVDVQSANAYSIVHEALNEKNKGKLKAFAEEHRGLFIGLVMEKLVWPNVSFGAKQ